MLAHVRRCPSSTGRGTSSLQVRQSRTLDPAHVRRCPSSTGRGTSSLQVRQSRTLDPAHVRRCPSSTGRGTSSLQVRQSRTLDASACEALSILDWTRHFLALCAPCSCCEDCRVTSARPRCCWWCSFQYLLPVLCQQACLRSQCIGHESHYMVCFQFICWPRSRKSSV